FGGGVSVRVRRGRVAGQSDLRCDSCRISAFRYGPLSMALIIQPAISRRSFLAGAASAAAAASLPRVTRAAPTPIREFKLTAAPARWPIVGKPHPETGVWCYGGRIPGPEIRVRQGEPVRMIVQNKLEEDTTGHWERIRVPSALDDVPGLTQSPQWSG